MPGYVHEMLIDGPVGHPAVDVSAQALVRIAGKFFPRLPIVGPVSIQPIIASAELAEQDLDLLFFL